MPSALAVGGAVFLVVWVRLVWFALVPYTRSILFKVQRYDIYLEYTNFFSFPP